MNTKAYLESIRELLDVKDRNVRRQVYLLYVALNGLSDKITSLEKWCQDYVEDRDEPATLLGYCGMQRFMLNRLFSNADSMIALLYENRIKDGLDEVVLPKSVSGTPGN
jgi:hypothetical protein